MTPHNNAGLNDYADIVLLPGDPSRAEYMSKFLNEVRMVNTVRSCWGYTGFYQNKPVSIQATGMGQPSLAIYVNELINTYKVKTLIRVGTCGAFDPEINVGDLVFPLSSCSEGNITTTKFYNDFNFSPCCNYDLLETHVGVAKKHGVRFHTGSIVSIDNFYRDDKDWWKVMLNHGISGVDMETHMLYYLAMKHKVKALTVNMVSDNLCTGKEMNWLERSTGIGKMLDVVLESIIQCDRI